MTPGRSLIPIIAAAGGEIKTVPPPPSPHRMNQARVRACAYPVSKEAPFLWRINAGNGTLPGACAPLAFPYVPMQENNPVRFSRMEALQTGTLFPGLDLPFKAAIQARTKLANTALVELMALDFAIDELGLYLTTHSKDQ